MSRPTLDTAMPAHLSLTGLSPSLVSFPKTVLLNLLDQFRGPNPTVHAPWFGLFRFRSPLLTESHVVFSSSGYLDVSVHRVPFAAYHVLHRLLVPRHPPYALISITKRFVLTGMRTPLHIYSVICVGNRPILFESVFFRLYC